MHEGWISSLGNKMPVEDWNNEKQAHDLKVKQKERGRAICEEALRTINGERQDQYGAPEDTFKKIADLWTAYLFSNDPIDLHITPAMVADMMILLKIAREKGGKGKKDNIVDLVGYAALGANMRGYDA
jgi:hypothetical protein